MPLILSPHALSRRTFLQGVLGTAALTARGALSALEVSSASRTPTHSEAWALLSDTHIAADPGMNARGINMASHLRQAVSEILIADARTPFAGVIVNGDCAYLNGQPDDYRTFAGLIEPASERGLPVHLLLGNHDDREHLIQGIQNHLGVTKSASPAPQSGSSVVSGKRVAKVRGAFCDWYLLDSLEHTNKTPGLLGTAQMQWLDAQLSAEPHRAALVMMHHNPHLHAELIQTGLRDTDELIDLLVSHAQVKALFFGHTHVAKTAVHRELHLINLPACAYRFRGAEPTGWTRALIDSSGCSLELFDTAQSHALHGKTIRLAWRPT